MVVTIHSGQTPVGLPRHHRNDDAHAVKFIANHFPFPGDD